jgi:hypothetical protein
MNVLLLVLALSASEGDDDRVEVGAPTRLSLGMGELGEQPEATPQSRIYGGARAMIINDRSDLFGTIAIAARVHGGYVLLPKLWLSFGLEAFEMRNVINASITQTQYALGPLTTAAHWNVYRSDVFSIAPYFRVLWPTSTAYVNARPWALEVGASMSYEIHRVLSWLAGVMLPLELTGLGSRVYSRFTPLVAMELALHPARWVDLLAGIEIKFGTDAAGGLEYFAPKAAFRFYPIKGFFVDLKAMFPLLGLERNDFVFGASLGWAFDDRPRLSAVASLPTSVPASVPASDTIVTPMAGPTSEPATQVTSGAQTP